MSRDPSSTLAQSLLAQRATFKRFLTARLGNEADAEDVLQHGLLKALERAGEIQDGEKATAWFYRLLRNAAIDHQRSRAASRRRDEAWIDEHVTVASDPEAERAICGCFAHLLPTLKPAQAALIRRVEFDGESVADAARALGLTPNHASVTLHRARAELRAKLVAFCGACAEGACLDCDCAPGEPPSAR